MKIETSTFLSTSIKIVSSQINIYKSKEKGLSYTEYYPNAIIVTSKVRNLLVFSVTLLKIVLF